MQVQQGSLHSIQSVGAYGGKHAQQERAKVSRGADRRLQKYEVLVDPYHNIPRLNLYQFDGSPLAPMYQVYKPPEMLPTTTLNPTNTATASAGATGKAKRGLDREVPLDWKLKFDNRETREMVHRINADRLWWIGLGFTGIGGLLYFGPRRLGLRI